MSRRAVRVLIAPVVLLLAAAGQQPPDKKDPQSSFEPKSKPGAGQKFLEKFVGEFDVAKSFHPKTGEPFRQKGECKQTMIHGGRFLQSEFTFATADGGKSTGTGLIGWEPESGRFTSVWIDSRQTRMSFRQGEDKFDGEQIVLFGKDLGGKEGRRSKTVTRLEDGGKKIVHRQYGVNADGTERLVMELVLTRKEAAPGK
jgi:hypothetical protein